VTFAQLDERMQLAARQQPVPQLHLRAAASTPYEIGGASDVGRRPSRADAHRFHHRPRPPH